MSEEAKEAPAKKKGKLPIILVLLLVLGGGGFFVMKSKGGSAPKVEVKAGEAIPLDKEFLVNLNGGSSYLRAELALEMREGFTKEGLEPKMPAIRDAINQILRSKTLQQVSASQTDELRKEICTAINTILIRQMKPDDKKAQKDFERAVDEDAKDKEDAKSPKDPWPCPAGPVLDLYFTSFTTQ